MILRVGIEIRERGSLDPELVARLGDEIPARVRENPLVRIPHHLVLVGRTLGLLSGVSRELGARVDLLASRRRRRAGARARSARARATRRLLSPAS